MDVETKVNLQIAQPEVESKDEQVSADCPICGNCGYFRVDLDPGHPDFGKIHVCKHRPPREPVTGGFADLFDINSMAKYVDCVRLLLSKRAGFLYIHGAYGVGKTALLRATVNEALGLGLNAKFTSAIDLLDNLRSAFDDVNPNQELTARVKYWRSVGVLCLDEIDRSNQTAFAEERLFQLLNDRYQDAIEESRLEGSLTLLASNLPPAKQPGYLSSRLADGRCGIIHIVGVDVRRGLRFQTERN